jgi:hypothetical protein
MKKIAILFFFVCTPFLATAQDSMDYTDCIPFFPANEGALLVCQSYDAQNNLLNKMIYRVNKTFEYTPGITVDVGFTMTDNKDNVIDRGMIEARCGEGDNFYLNMKNRSFSPEAMDILASNTALIGNFLDYPNIFNDTYPYTIDFSMEDNGFSIESKETGEYFNVRIYGRHYDEPEMVTTPAGTFNAAKVSFNFDVVNKKESKTCKGVEWYAPRTGIVRSETYDNKGKLLNYTILTETKNIK